MKSPASGGSRAERSSLPLAFSGGLLFQERFKLRMYERDFFGAFGCRSNDISAAVEGGHVFQLCRVRTFQVACNARAKHFSGGLVELNRELMLYGWRLIMTAGIALLIKSIRSVIMGIYVMKPEQP